MLAIASAFLGAAPLVGLLLVTEAAQVLTPAPLRKILLQPMLRSAAERPDVHDAAAAIGVLTAF